MTNYTVFTSGLLCFFLVLLGISFYCSYYIKKHKLVLIPEAGVTLIIGVIAGAIVHYVPDFQYLEDVVRFDDTFFMYVLLPPIMLEAGYNLRKGTFYSNFGSVSLFAVFGTVISGLSFGAMMSLVVSMGLCYPLTVYECFLWGSLVSARGAGAVLAVMKDLKVEKNLFMNVFSESVLNDAAAYVMYVTYAAAS